MDLKYLQMWHLFGDYMNCLRLSYTFTYIESSLVCFVLSEIDLGVCHLSRLVQFAGPLVQRQHFVHNSGPNDFLRNILQLNGKSGSGVASKTGVSTSSP